MTRGLRKIGSLERLGYRPGAKKERTTNAEARAAAIEAMTDEQKEKLGQEHALHNADMAQWRKDFDQHGPARAGIMLVERKAARGTDKIADFYARRMVEGDTDLNHDNVEAAE